MKVDYPTAITHNQFYQSRQHMLHVSAY